jgi:suppressor of ftsI
VLATMVVSGPVLQPKPLPIDLIPFEDLSQLPVDNYRTTTFEEPGAPLFLAIDGKHFDPDRIDQTVKLGALEEWTIRNTSSHRHPFHIHVNDFQVVAVNGVPVEASSYMDTVDLPPGSETTIRMRFADFDGKFVYHCHILSHEDFGMMATVDVVP